MKCLDHGRDEPTPDYREMQLENFLDSLPQVLEDCNNKKRKAPVLEYLPPPPPIPCHMHHEVQGMHGFDTTCVLWGCSPERHA